MQDVQTRSVLATPPTMAWTRRKFGFQRRRVTLWAWLILFPYLGALPQISQAIAIATPRLQDEYSLTLYQTRASLHHRFVATRFGSSADLQSLP